jgi:hypothetical protein
MPMITLRQMAMGSADPSLAGACPAPQPTRRGAAFVGCVRNGAICAFGME